MSDVFGDIELADVWDADPTIDPCRSPAASICYASRSICSPAARSPRGVTCPPSNGTGSPSSPTSSSTASTNANPTTRRCSPAAIHEERTIQSWDDLSPDEQQIAIDLIDLIVDWLEREGPR